MKGTRRLSSRRKSWPRPEQPFEFHRIKLHPLQVLHRKKLLSWNLWSPSPDYRRDRNFSSDRHRIKSNWMKGRGEWIPRGLNWRCRKMELVVCRNMWPVLLEENGSTNIFRCLNYRYQQWNFIQKNLRDRGSLILKNLGWAVKYDLSMNHHHRLFWECRHSSTVRIGCLWHLMFCIMCCVMNIFVYWIIHDISHMT